MSGKTDQQDSRISGVVRSFMTEKGFGFINGDDGRSYFVHIKNVEGGELVDGQTVVFEGRPGPKGYKALRVIPGAPPPPQGQAYESPNRFIWTKDSAARGFETIFTLGSGWAESNNPNEARALLERASADRGGNAVLNVQLEKYSRSDGCSNYYYTMHRFTGDYANVQKIISTTDQDWISRSIQWEQEFLARIENENAQPATPSIGATSLVPPGAIKHSTMMLLSWTFTVAKILSLALLALAKTLRR
ncbi:cold shock domain-containing protein [Ectopseudomonas mendocina]|uniref:Cold-shock protein n=1 Tax=Ectopseudomonas mendocina S5.2 TaxID=1225174 RepID=A0ABN4IS04_ECTME|nr:cold shock domain-containing protein [Pseudomonas mendocina]ALN18473.1 cold-shock protein [Pseudomonas mendocina S5.2]KES00681.1 cold-shock protein [Pseudomonas mendocina]